MIDVRTFTNGDIAILSGEDGLVLVPKARIADLATKLEQIVKDAAYEETNAEKENGRSKAL